MAQYGTAWVDVRGNTAPLGADISAAVSKGANMFAGAARNVLGDLGRTTAQLAAGFTALGAAGAVSLAKVGAQYNTLEQSSLKAFETLLGTEDAAKRMQADLREFAKSSPFPRQAFISGTQQLLGFGMEAQKIIPTLDAIQQAVAATGGSGQDLTEIVRVLAKIQGTGKVTAITLNELGIRGIDAAKLIGSQMGKTEGEIRDSITRGSLDGGKAIDALVAGMQERFGGAAEGLKETWVGAADRVKGAWRDIGSGLMDPFIAKTGGGTAVESANKLADSLRLIEKNILPVVVPLSQAFGDALLRGASAAEDLVAKITPLGAANRLAGFITMAERARQSLVGLEGVAVGVGVALAGMAGRSVLGPLGFLMPAISPITGALVGLVAGSRDGRDAMRQLGDAAGSFASGAGRQLVEGLGRLAQELAGPVARLVEGLGTGLLDLASGVIPPLVSGLDRIGPPLGKFMDATGELVSAILPPLVDLLSVGLGAALPVVTVAVEAAAAAVQILADHSWILVPALSAIVALKVAGAVSAMAPAFSQAAASAQYLVSSLQGIAATRGVSTLTAGMGVAKASVGGLATSLVSGLNPAVLGVTAALAVGGIAVSRYASQQRELREATDALTDAFGQSAKAFRSDLYAGTAKQLEGQLSVINDLGVSISELNDVAVVGSDSLGDLATAFDQAFRDSTGIEIPGEEGLTRLREMLQYMPAELEEFGLELGDAVASGNLDLQDAIRLITEMQDVAKATTASMADARNEYSAMARDALESGDISEDAFRRVSDAIVNAETPTELNAAIFELMNLLGDGLPNATRDAALSVDEASNVLKVFGTEVENAANATDNAGDSVVLTQDKVDGLAESVKEAKTKVKELSDELLNLAGERDKEATQRDALQAISDLYAAQQKRIEEFAAATERLTEAQSSLAEARATGDPARVARAEQAVTDAIKAQTDAVSNMSNTFDINTDAGRRNREEVQKVVESMEAWVAALGAGDASGNMTRMGLATIVEKLKELRRDGIIPTDAEYNRLLDTFNLTPSDIDVRVAIATADAEASVEKLQGVLDEIPGGPKTDAIKAQVQVLIDQGSYEDANRLLWMIPGVLEAEQAWVEAHAQEQGLNATEWRLNWLARERKAWIKVDADTTAARDKVARMLSTLPTWMGFDPARISPGFGVRGGRAEGGPVGPGMWLVGEQGPELVDLRGHGHVYTAEETSAMLDGKTESGSQFTDAQIERLISALGERNAMDISVSSDTTSGRRIGAEVSDLLWLRGL